jgi:hypothetical protein
MTDRPTFCVQTLWQGLTCYFYSNLWTAFPCLLLYMTQGEYIHVYKGSSGVDKQNNM